MRTLTEILPGTGVKFSIVLRAEGFNQDIDDWTVELMTGNVVVKHYEKSELVHVDGVWLLPIETEGLRPTRYDIRVTAQVADDDFPDGVRSEVVRQHLFCIK